MSKAQFRILMLLTVLSGLMGGGVVSWLFPGRAVFAQGTAPKVIEAQKFRVVDGEGKQRAWFGLLADGSPILVLADAAGKSRVELSLRSLRADGGPLLALYDATGQPRAWLSLLQDGRLNLGMCNAAGQQRAGLFLEPDGNPGLALWDAAGEQRAGLFLEPDGSPSLVLCDADRTVLFSAPTATIYPLELPGLTSPDVIESRMDGEFEGWDGDTIFKLANGQIWRQTSYAYTYQYAYRPEVLIFRTPGGYKMKVDGVSDTIYVERLN